MTSSSDDVVAVVLAAGGGTRMRSRRPKVLHEVAGRMLLGWSLEAARAAGCRQIVVVVGHDGDRVRQAFDDSDLEWVEQREQLGTAHAVQCAREALAATAGTALVLYGDVPLVRSSTLEKLVDASRRGWGALATASLEQPGALGRVVVESDGRLGRIVEAADASEEELKLRTVNAGHYALGIPELFDWLDRIDNDNAQGEYYLPDALNLASASGRDVRCVALDDPSEAWGVNTRAELARAEVEAQSRLTDALLAAGVTLLGPATVRFEVDVSVEPDVVIHPGVTLLGHTSIASGAVIHTGSWIRDSGIGPDVEIHPYSVLDGAVVGQGAAIGPHARLRPGTRLAERVRIGNYVEVKNSTLGPGSKANHLAYVGDAEVGADVNIGAGAVTCNYDGEKKHRTTIRDRAFIGSDTMLVAPVTVGEGSITAAGSTITQDVPDDALAVGRARQRNIENWSRRRH